MSTADIDHLVEGEAAEIVIRYLDGTETDPHYDPADARTATLDSGIAGSGYRVMGLGALLVLVAVGMKVGFRFLPPVA